MPSFRMLFIILFPLLSAVQGYAYTTSYNDLTFTTDNQSIWENGSSPSPTNANNSVVWSGTSTIGAITGEENVVIAPGWSETIPAQYIPVSVPPYYSCDSWGTSIIGTKYCKSSSWKGGYTYQEKISDAYTIQHDPITADTRSGLKVTLSTSGDIGVTSDLGVDGGSVDGELTYDSTLDIPDAIATNTFFNLAPQASLTEGKLNTELSKLTGTVDTHIDVDLRTTTTNCLAGFGCDTGSATYIDVNTGNMELLESNTSNVPNGSSLFGFDDYPVDLYKFTLNVDAIYNGGYVSPSIGIPGLGVNGVGINLGSISFDYPELATTATLKDGRLISNNSYNNIVAIEADVDGLATARGLFPPVGIVGNSGLWTFRGDVLDAGVGPTVDFSQNFELSSALMIGLSFSRDVLIDDGSVINSTDYWSGKFSDIPDIALLSKDLVEVLPTFWTENTLINNTSLTVDFSAFVKIMQGSITFAGISVWQDSLLDMQEWGIPLESLTIYDKSFELGGFNQISGPSFFLQASSLGSNNQNYQDGAPVPEPATMILFLVGVMVISFQSLRIKTMRQ